MTTLDPSHEISSDLPFGLSHRRDPRQPFPMMAVFHFVTVAGVALICYVLVH